MIAALALLIAGPADTPKTLFEVPASEHLIEGIASDGRTVWVTSVLDRHVIAWRDGKLTVMRVPESAGAPFAIAYDHARDWLWIATNCMDDPKTEACGAPSLIAIDRKGRLKRQLSVGEGFHPGDVSLGNGAVFVSDTANGAVYRCAGDCRSLEPLATPEGKASAQGSALYADGSQLIVADYSRGIVRIDLATRADTLVTTADGKRLRGIDGLARIGDWFIGVANYATPGRLVRFRIDGGGHLTDVDALDTAGLITDPTQIVLRGGEILAIADSQWASYGTGKPGRAGQRPTPIVALPLGQLLKAAGKTN